MAYKFLSFPSRSPAGLERGFDRSMPIGHASEVSLPGGADAVDLGDRIRGRKLAGLGDQDERHVEAVGSLGGRGHARPLRGDDLLDRHVDAASLDGDADLGPHGWIAAAIDVEEGRHVRGGDQPHGVLVERAVAVGGADGGEAVATLLADEVALHVRSQAVVAKAPVGKITAEEGVAFLAALVDEMKKREPAVAGLLAQEVEGVVGAEELL